MGRGLAAAGLTGVGIELRGFGENPEPRGHVADFGLYYADLEKVFGVIREQYPERKVFVLGESMGGLIASMLAARHPEWFAGLIAISPAFRNVIKFRLRDYLMIVPYQWFDPCHPIPLPFTVDQLSRDPEMQRRLEIDPREVRNASARMLLSILLEFSGAGKKLERIAVTVLFLLAGRDYLTDPKASEAAFRHCHNPASKLIRYPDMLHALSIDQGWEKVLEDTLAWMGERLKS